MKMKFFAMLVGLLFLVGCAAEVGVIGPPVVYEPVYAPPAVVYVDPWPVFPHYYYGPRYYGPRYYGPRYHVAPHVVPHGPPSHQVPHK